MAQTETPELSPGGQSTYWPIQKGTNVTMHCWTEGPNADGGKKWFDLSSSKYPYTEGYVRANSVKYQAKVGLCR